MAILWPFLAILLTLPILLFQYIRYHRADMAQILFIYLFIAYALAIFMAFTLYPLPDNPASFCAAHHITPQLNLFEFVGDLIKNGGAALWQIMFNLVLFMPLGMFLRNLFGQKFWKSIGLTLLASAFIEVAQLTGLFGIFPCSYRLFDVDDLLFNTLGAAAGFGLARWLPNVLKVKKRQTINHNPGLIQRLVLLWGDYLLVSVVSGLTVLLLDFAGAAVSDTAGRWILFGWFMLAELVLPLFWKGQTIMAHLAGATFDDRKRGGWRRLWYHLLRAGFFALILFTGHWTAAVLAVIAWIYWLVKKRTLYSRLAGK